MGMSALPVCCSSQSAVESLYRMSRADRRHFRHFGWSFTLYRKEALKNAKLRDKSPIKESYCSDFIWCPSKTSYFSCCSANLRDSYYKGTLGAGRSSWRRCRKKIKTTKSKSIINFDDVWLLWGEASRPREIQIGLLMSVCRTACQSAGS